MFLTVLAVLVVLSPIVIVHEFGHYIACRLTGIRVKEFSFGFGKVLWHKKVGYTDYQIRLIPFGGFVEPAGQMFHPEGAKEGPKPYEFAAKPWYSKFFMVVNGALFNYLLAAVIFGTLIYIQGMPVNDATKIPAVVGTVAQGYPVEKLDIKPGDLILSVNDKNIENWKDFTNVLADRNGKDVTFTYKRADQILTATVKDSDFNPKYPNTLGITVEIVYNPVPWWKAAGLGFYQCYYWTKMSLSSLAESFTKKKAPELAGPIGIVNVIHQSVHRSLLDFVFLIALLSVAVGMFNLFPIPILDGGYALVYLWEGLTKKLPTEKTLNIAVNIGMYILIALVIYASYSDVKRIFFKNKTAAEQTAPATEKPAEAENTNVQD
ncbi:MAG: site-2 protease family protein [Elusimicrobiaceae bacterium]|nr:site-2 protease family protein [Elusimicrobiaceae bacterium]